MKIHLIKTPDYSLKNLKEVYNLLDSFKGVMEFYCPEFKFNKKNYPFLNIPKIPKSDLKKSKDSEKLKALYNFYYALQWEQIYKLCKDFRKEKEIEKNDFVFLLTSRYNELNWFSHISKEKNGFIHTADLEKFISSKSNSKYPISFQIIENIIQNLMKIEMDDPENAGFHMKNKGCINDFCEDKTDVILKLRTADICNECFDKIKKMKIDKLIINHSFQILEGIRTQFLINKDLHRNIGTFSIICDKEYRLLIPLLRNREIKLDPILKTLYILFLKYPEGLKVNNLAEHKEELKKIYKKLEPPLPDEDQEEINFRIVNLTLPSDGSFSQNKSRLNKELRTQLGDFIANQFEISGSRGKPFKVGIPAANIDIQF